MWYDDLYSMKCFKSNFDAIGHWKINWHIAQNKESMYEHLMGLNPKQCLVKIYNTTWHIEDIEKMYHFLYFI